MACGRAVAGCVVGRVRGEAAVFVSGTAVIMRRAGGFSAAALPEVCMRS